MAVEAPAKRGVFLGLFKGTAYTLGSGLLIFLVAMVPLVVGNFYSFVFAQTLIYAIAVLGLVIVVGLLGQISLMHAELMGLGAGITAALVSAHDWNFWAAGGVAVLVGYFTGIIVGLPALRLRGLALALVTLAIARLFDQLVLPSQALSGGVGGRSIPRPNLGPIGLQSDRVYFEVALAAFVITVLIVLSIRRGRLGRIFRSIRESERGAAASGVSLTRYKLLAFALSAAIASFAGVMSIGISNSYTPAPYDWLHSLLLLAFLMIMGSATVSGALLAMMVYLTMPAVSHVKALDQYQQLFAGLLLMGVMMRAPKGLVPKVAEIARGIRDRRRERRSPMPAFTATEPASFAPLGLSGDSHRVEVDAAGAGRAGADAVEPEPRTAVRTTRETKR